MRTERSALAVRTAMLAAAAAATVLLQCGEDQTKPTPPNEPPIARITAGASSSDSAGIDYRVDFEWEGHDADGTVAGFEWAIDDTVTEAAWHWTPRPGEHIEFTATTPMPGTDSLLADWHSFFLRAVDDDSARSAPDIRHFNVRTIAPISRIIRPNFPRDYHSVPRSFQIEWSGDDIDGPAGRPVAFEYKLVLLPEGGFPAPDATYRDQLVHGDNVLSGAPGGSGSDWVRVPESTHNVQLDVLADGRAYVFGVRGIDAAAAVEPLLEANRNMAAFVVSSSVWSPRITVLEPNLGSATFPDIGSAWSVAAPAGTTLGLSWSAETWDGSPVQWNYGYDIPDPADSTRHDPQGLGGWIGWGDWNSPVVPVHFAPEDAGTTHFLYLRARQAEGPAASGIGTVRFDVVGFAFDRFALLVDDARFQVAIPDFQHDPFILDVFLRRLRDYGEVDHRTIFRGSVETGELQMITLEEMGRYRYILWSCEPRNVRSGIAYDLNGGQNNNNRNLATYLALGGRLFVFGGRSGGMERSDFGYPVPPPSGPHDPKYDMLYYRFLHLRDWIVSAACAGHAVCDPCYGYVSGLVGARALNPAFPDLTLDESKWDPWSIIPQEGIYRGGLKSWEGSMHLGGGEAEEVPGLDSLYAAVTWDRALAPGCSVPSPVSGAVCAVRYESTPQDTLEHRAHGRTIGFLFQPYWFLPDQIQSAGTAAIEWLVRGK